MRLKHISKYAASPSLNIRGGWVFGLHRLLSNKGIRVRVSRTQGHGLQYGLPRDLFLRSYHVFLQPLSSSRHFSVATFSSRGHSHLPSSSREQIFSFATIATLRLRHRIFARQLRGRQARSLFDTTKGN
jgi:hypothetical protein